MGKKKFSRYYSKIEFDQDVRKFLEENKNKIPKGVEVEGASKSSINETIPEEEIVIHASTFKLGLCLPFHVLIEEILTKHDLVPTQLAPNCWRVMFGIIALNQICKINLGWNEFCHCYTVKSNRGIYYFSHKEGKPDLVTGLPRSEKGWESDDLIRLKGDWDKLHSVPRSETAADHKPKGFKSSDANQCDIDEALRLTYEKRNWRHLVDHPAYLELHRESKIAEESQSTLLTATGPAYSNLGGDVRSVEVVGLTTTDVLSSPPSSYKKQKLMHCDSSASKPANLVRPYLARSDYESSIPSEAAAANSKATTDKVNHEQPSEYQETVDQSSKNINSIDQLSKRQVFEGARLLGAQSILKLIDSYANHIEELEDARERKDKELEELKLQEKDEAAVIKDQDRRTKELEAAYERKDKELEELKLQKKEEADVIKDQDRRIKELEAANERKDKELEELKSKKKKEAAYKKIEKKFEKKWGEMYAAITEREKANKPRVPTWMESPSSSSSKNAGHLTSQSQNKHNIEGAAAGVTPPNVGPNLLTSPHYQNIDIPRNDDIKDQQQQQQQIVEPSSSNNGSRFIHSLVNQTIYSDSGMDWISINYDHHHHHHQQQQQQQIIETSSSNNSSNLLNLLDQPIPPDNIFDWPSSQQIIEPSLWKLGD